ncbi:hypothetical protein B0H63DRAFT_527170 [Podospora didyma]|uniref:Uncharacterized protein n=1 Tax=Podospora didyma TaxID=330526 RepID=A0AAE0KA34_9PEZI|nr:hypothetical protein B0H63DRAFT_527170 [Podospora didyma]
MPQEGTSHNAIEPGHNIIHGAGSEPESTRVSRADKTAEMPEPEKGAGLEGMNASGGTSAGLAQGPNRGQGGRRSKN